MRAGREGSFSGEGGKGSREAEIPFHSSVPLAQGPTEVKSMPTIKDDLIRGWIADGRERAHLARLKERDAAEAGDVEAATEWRRIARALESKSLEVESWWNAYEAEGEGQPRRRE
jgi:hypothetical protein